MEGEKKRRGGKEEGKKKVRWVPLTSARFRAQAGNVLMPVLAVLVCDLLASGFVDLFHNFVLVVRVVEARVVAAARDWAEVPDDGTALTIRLDLLASSHVSLGNVQRERVNNGGLVVQRHAVCQATHKCRDTCNYEPQKKLKFALHHRVVTSRERG